MFETGQTIKTAQEARLVTQGETAHCIEDVRSADTKRQPDAVQSSDPAQPTDSVQATDITQPVETLTAAYERLRHETNPEVLHDFARQALPDRADQTNYSRVTALLEAVAGNQHTPVEDRAFLAAMPFPNVLMCLCEDPFPQVRQVVASNTEAKGWLIGRLVEDKDHAVKNAALTNPACSWKMRLEGAQNPDTDAVTLELLAKLGALGDTSSPVVLSAMVRRAVALNPSTTPQILEQLSRDTHPDVLQAVRLRASALS